MIFGFPVLILCAGLPMSFIHITPSKVSVSGAMRKKQAKSLQRGGSNEIYKLAVFGIISFAAVFRVEIIVRCNFERPEYTANASEKMIVPEMMPG